MCKKIALVIIFILCFSLISCGISSIYNLDYDLYEKAKYVDEDEGEYSLMYQDVKYYRADSSFLQVSTDMGDPKEDDVEIGWEVRWPYVSVFYADKMENPIFVYDPSTNDLFLREDYDYRSDIFVLEGSENKILFSEMITDVEVEYDLFKSHQNKIDLYSEKYPRLRMEFVLLYENDLWCVKGSNSVAYVITDSFVEILIENGIISN